MKITNLVASVARRLGRVARQQVVTSGPAILAGGMFFSGTAHADVLFSENFESLTLQEAVSESEDLSLGDVWTDELPAGWTRDNTDTPEPDPEDPTVGPEEFYGFTFVNKDWWIQTAGNQDRALFEDGEGTIMVADADEYDDQGKVDGRDLDEGGGVGFPDAMNVFITTPSINLNGFDKNSARLIFDSSFRPYDMMTGLVDVSFDDGATWKNLVTLDLEAFDGVNSSLDRVSEEITVSLGAPASAAAAKVRFALTDAGNDWWWAVDNIQVTANAGGVVAGDFDKDGQLTAADINQLSDVVRSGNNVAGFDLNGDNVVTNADREMWVNVLKKTYFGDANLDGQFNSSDFVSVFSAGQYEDGVAGNSTWESGDWNGDFEFDSADFVAAFQAGGYELGPRAAVSAVPEPSSVGVLLAGMSLAGRWVLRRRRDA